MWNPPKHSPRAVGSVRGGVGASKNDEVSGSSGGDYLSAFECLMKGSVPNDGYTMIQTFGDCGIRGTTGYQYLLGGA